MTTPTFFDRDLSWLSFNYRVLMEAEDTQTPALERLRFLAIYSSNLDEFSRVRISELRKLAAINKGKINKELNIKPVEVLEAVRLEVGRQLEHYGKVLESVLEALREADIYIAPNISDLSISERQELSAYFKSHVLAYLRPYVFGVTARA